METPLRWWTWTGQAGTGRGPGGGVGVGGRHPAVRLSGFHPVAQPRALWTRRGWVLLASSGLTVAILARRVRVGPEAPGTSAHLCCCRLPWCRPGERGRRRGSARETFQRPRKAPLSSLPQPDPAPFLPSWEGMYPGGKRGQTWGEPDPHLFHETRKCFGRQVSMDTTPHPHPRPPAPWRPEADSSAPASVGVHREATCLWCLWYGKCHSLRGRFRGGASVEARFSFRPRPTPLARWVRARETDTDRGHGRGGCVCARTCVHIHAHTHVPALMCAQRKAFARQKQTGSPRISLCVMSSNDPSK